MRARSQFKQHHQCGKHISHGHHAHTWSATEQQVSEMNHVPQSTPVNPECLCS